MANQFLQVKTEWVQKQRIRVWETNATTILTWGKKRTSNELGRRENNEAATYNLTFRLEKHVHNEDSK